MSQRSSRIRNVFEPIDRKMISDMWKSRFGMDEVVFSNFRFFRKGPSIWAINDIELPRLSYEALGLRIMNIKDDPWKPTTAALRVFGKYAKKNLIDLEPESAMEFMRGESIFLNRRIDEKRLAEHSDDSVRDPRICSDLSLESGYVVVFYSGNVLGCGLYSHGKLVSQIPKELRIT